MQKYLDNEEKFKYIISKNKLKIKINKFND